MPSDPFNTAWSALGANSGSTDNGVDNSVHALAVSGGNVYAGGRFAKAYNYNGNQDNLPYGPNIGAVRIAGWNGTSWSALADGGNGAADIGVDSIAISGDDVYVGGWFTTIGNIMANRIAKWNQRNNTWSALGSDSGPIGNGLNSVVKFLTVAGNDVYVGGLFSTAYNGNGSSVSVNHIAKWNRQSNTWSALGNGSGSTGNGVNSDVVIIEVSGNDVYVGGDFTTAYNSNSSSVSANNLVKWNGASWSALGSGSGPTGNGVNGTVDDIEVSESGVVYVGGQFTTAYNSSLVPPNNIVSTNRIAKWNATTMTWSSLGNGSGPTGNGVSGGVSAIGVSGSDVYVGGLFTTAYNSNSSSVSANNIVRWDGASWSALGSGTGSTGNGVSFYINDIVVNGSDVYVGGGFGRAYNGSGNSVNARGIAKWNGLYWSALGSGVPGDVVGLALKGDDVYVGGRFSMAGCNPSINLARYSPPATNITVANANATFSTSGQTVSLNVSINSNAGTVNEGLVTFKVRKDSAPIGSPVTGLVTNGRASTNYTLPGGTTAGTYTIEAFYSGSIFGSSSDNGILTINPLTIYEADVAPRPNGDGSMTSADWEMTGRFAIGLDVPAEGSEFQRADCAPRDGLGDGRITLADWVQAGRYAADLDAKTQAGGPTKAAARFTLQTANSADGAAGRALRVGVATFLRGQVNTLQIEMEAQGNENAVAFTLNYDPTLMSFSEAVLGQGLNEAKLYVNTARATNGQIGVAFALPTGKVITPGTAGILTLRFLPTGSANNAITKVGFGDQFIKSEVVGVQADAMTGTTFSEGAVLITGRAVTSVSAADYSGPTLARESIVAAFGTGLATTTEEAKALPLPTTLGGTMVKVKDSKEVERLAPLFFVSPGQVNYQIPAETAEGIATITVTNVNGTVSSGLIQVVKTKPGLFSADATGRGLPAAYAVRVKPDGTQILEPVIQFDSATNKFVAVPIDLSSESDQVILVLFGAGVRNRNSLVDVKVVIGGAECPVEYAGAQGTFVGLDQVNVLLLRSLAGRSEVDVILKVQDQMANTMKVNIK